jgi:RNA polymerase sigma-70 factor (ECF subfamily)
MYGMERDFTELVNNHKGIIYKVCHLYCLESEHRKDLFQEIVIQLWKAYPNFRKEAKLSTWIYRITINKSLDFKKAKKTKKRFAFITNLFFEDSNEVKHDKVNFNHPGVELENKEAVEKIFHEINQLPTNQKTEIILSRIEQKSQAEVAQIMNLSIKAVESLYQRAKQNLSKKLKN